jgi:cytochrome c oxidase cbb3-type subunit III
VRLSPVMSLAAVLLTAVRLGAQQPSAPKAQAPPPKPAPPAVAPTAAHPPTDEDGGFDPASVERGRQLLVQQCGFCHGSNARGGQQGPDLTRSDLVQSDENGRQLGAFLKVGRPELKMPRFDLPESDVTDLAAFLHSTIQSVSNRDEYKILDILVGDPKAGEAFFNGAGKCSACHSATGDLKGIGADYDPTTLQGRLVMPRGGRRRRSAPGGGRETPPFLEPSAVRATVKTAAGETFTGPLILLTDFEVTIFDGGSGQPRTWLRNDGVPAVTLTDPLQAHVDMLRQWNDTDIHNMTAFLASLK